MEADNFNAEEDYTKGKSFWKWYFASKQNWLFGLLFNAFAIFCLYLMSLDPPAKIFFSFIFVPVIALWYFTIRDYRNLKRGIRK